MLGMWTAGVIAAASVLLVTGFIVKHTDDGSEAGSDAPRLFAVAAVLFAAALVMSTVMIIK